MHFNNWKHHADKLILVGSIEFFVLTTIAMFLYTGGTNIDPTSSGYLYFSNFYSDLGRTVSLSSNPNIISCVLFTISFNIYAILFSLFLFAFPSLFKDRNKKLLTVIGIPLGLVSAATMFVIGFIPLDLYEMTHYYTNAVALITAAILMMLYVFVIFRCNHFPNRYGGLLTLVALLTWAHILITTFGPAPYTNFGLLLHVISQKFVFISWIIIFPIIGYGARQVGRFLSPMVPVSS